MDKLSFAGATISSLADNAKPLAGGLGNKMVSTLIGPDTIKEKLTDATNKKLTSGARNWGREVANQAMGVGGKTPTGLSGQIGSAIATELPDAPDLNMMPKLMLNIQQRGLGQGLANMFKSSQDSESGFAPEVDKQIGEAFKGSPAARTAANTVAPVVNKAFDHVTGQSIFGRGLKMIMDPGAYFKDLEQEAGIGTPAGASGASAGGAGATT